LRTALARASDSFMLYPSLPSESLCPPTSTFTSGFASRISATLSRIFSEAGSKVERFDMNWTPSSTTAFSLVGTNGDETVTGTVAVAVVPLESVTVSVVVKVPWIE
jgi:hypothetical protein